MEKIYVIRIDEVFDFENFDHTPMAYRNYDDAKKRYNEIKEEIREAANDNEYDEEIEGETYLELFPLGNFSKDHICVYMYEIELQ